MPPPRGYSSAGTREMANPSALGAEDTQFDSVVPDVETEVPDTFRARLVSFTWHSYPCLGVQ